MTEDEQKAVVLNHALLLMQAGINSSRSGDRDVAVELFEGAKQRFESLQQPTDAGIARAWAKGLRERLAQECVAFSTQ